MKKIIMLLLVATCFLFAREYKRSDFPSALSLDAGGYDEEEVTTLDSEPKSETEVKETLSEKTQEAKTEVKQVIKEKSENEIPK